MSRRIALLVAALLLPIAAGAQRAAAGPDSARLTQAQQLVATGNGAAGRAIIDSVLASHPEGSSEYAEALYWKGLLAASAADAERAYRTLVVEYTTSMRAPDALLRLAQLEDARGDRPAALQHLERLARDYRVGSADTRAGLWASRLLFDENDAPSACVVLSLARAGVPSGDVELGNQVDYQNQRCLGVDLTGAGTNRASQSVGSRESGVGSRVPRDTTTPDSRLPTPDSARTERVASSRAEYSVQVAAYRTRAEAEASVRRMSRRGYEARVAGASAPYRVRIGRFGVRSEAVALQQRLRKAKIDAIVVDAEPRGASAPAPRPSAKKPTSRPKRH